tara:strand:- start:898 stop:1200 length:303 start_codon:yes stop_codon:yes gene_type:complete
MEYRAPRGRKMDHNNRRLSKESPPVITMGFRAWREITSSQALTVINLVLNPTIRRAPMTISNNIRPNIKKALPDMKYKEAAKSDSKFEAGSIKTFLGKTP